MTAELTAPLSLRQALSRLQVAAREQGQPGIAEATARLRRSLGSRPAVRFHRELAQPVVLVPATSTGESLDIPSDATTVVCPTCERTMLSLLDSARRRAWFCPDCDVTGGSR